MQVTSTHINGLQHIHIQRPGNIAFIGIATRAGSNFEKPEEAGIAHFAEHLFFSGTASKSAKELSQEFALSGIYQNAYTGNRHILYHCTVPVDNIYKAWDLMIDMLFNSTYSTEEIEKERSVIVEEKKMYADQPVQAFYEQLGLNLFKWDKGHDALGTMESINSIDRDKIINYLNSKCNLDNMVLITCGDIIEENIKEHLESIIPEQHHYLNRSTPNECSNILWNNELQLKSNNELTFKYVKGDITQAHVALILEAFNPTSKHYHPIRIVNNYLCGGMFSKLFNRIRQELGLCYSIQSYPLYINYPSNVLYNINSGVALDKVDSFIEECEKEFDKLIKDGMDNTIFEAAKQDMAAYIYTRTETSEGQVMHNIHKLAEGDYYNISTPQEETHILKQLTLEKCNETAEAILSQPHRWAAMLNQ